MRGNNMAIQAKDDKLYTYGDYISWSEDERWELIDGVAYMMAAPNTKHQRLIREMSVQIYAFLSGADHNDNCEMFFAPFDVRLPDADEDDRDVKSTVQPDIVIICDPGKLDEKGCRGAPDFVIEILSPSTASRDSITKMELYERHGVKEYWIVDPINDLVFVRVIGKDARYGSTKTFKTKDVIEATVLPGLAVKLTA
jgi:Uma2 family endonuclease